MNESPEKLRILHTSFHRGWGGEPNRIYNLCSGLLDRGHHVVVAAPRESTLLQRCQDRGITVCNEVLFDHRFRPLSLWKDVRLLRNIIAEQNIDLVHTHGSRDTWAGALAAGKTTPFFRTRHNLKRNRTGMANTWLYGRLRGLVAISQAVRAEFEKNQLVPMDRVAVIHSAVDLTRFDLAADGTSIRRDLALDDDDILVAAVGRLAPEKGHAWLLDAAPDIFKKCRNVRIAIFGKGELHDTLQAGILARGLEERFTLAGFHERVDRVYAACDVLVFPSLSEGLGTAVIEGLAMARPVVATAVGGIPEILTHGKTGVLVPERDSRALAEAVVDMVDDLAAAKEMGRRGREDVQDRFTVDALTEQTLSFYFQMLGA